MFCVTWRRMETSGQANGGGQSLLDNSSELMRCLETLRGERDALSRDLELDMEERNKIQLDVQVLVRRLNTVTENATRRARARYVETRQYEENDVPK